LFQIRRIYDDIIPIDRKAVHEVQQILRDQFPLLPEREIEELPESLRDPLKHRFRSILFVAAGARSKVRGFALLHHAPDLAFCYLDFISVAKWRTGGGIGGALYERVREEARSLGSAALFFECLPDDPAVCRDETILKQNAARLRFYERYGARPVVNTLYETPIRPDDPCPPYLVCDLLGGKGPLGRRRGRLIVRAILERKYGDACPRGYIDRVVQSFKDDPVLLREPKYARTGETQPALPAPAMEKRIALVVNDRHALHHVHERGYVESPVRVGAIQRELERMGIFDLKPVRHFSEKRIRAVHDPGFIHYFKRVCTLVQPGESVYPYVFPIRNRARPPRELPVRAGYYCIDTFTPLNRDAYDAAKRAVDCGLTAAEEILKGRRLAYALVRPPGHHAERSVFGGFCYFNTAAIAAHFLSAYGRTAVLDVDYHHGNGTQEIFYDRPDVLTVSIHGHPTFAYPYFSGFREERGEGAGEGFNLNFPLEETVDGERYRSVLDKALAAIARFEPYFLIVALGLDTAKGDPTGTWLLGRKDFYRNGRMIGALRLPTIVIQEGGYRIRSLGANARSFFRGLWDGALGAENSSVEFSPGRSARKGRSEHGAS